MALSKEEKERLSDDIVAILRAEDPEAEMKKLAEKVANGDEGEHGTNSVVLAVAQAMAEHLKRAR